MKSRLMKRMMYKCKYSGSFGNTKTPLNPAKTNFEVIAGAFFLKCKCPTAKAGEQAEVGRTRLFPLALRGKAV
jgi:hypothetical protein